MVQLGCDALLPTLTFFTEELSFRIDAIFPADNPKTALISGYGLRLQLSAGVANATPRISLLCDDPATVDGGRRELTAPNGTVVRFVEADPAYRLPATVQALVVSRSGDATHWTVGRAGLRYRDLLPERHGGAFIASHIRILEGGEVPDYVHYHKVRFQMIFCRTGWVRVLYEGQGGPILLKAGDCVLQPPMIRHRVLESSAGAEVIEVGTPAEHITIAEHQLTLPSEDLPATHDFGGQRFVCHLAEAAPWKPWRLDGFEHQDTGIGAATDGLAGVRIVRPAGTGASTTRQQHESEFCFYFVLAGETDICYDDQRLHLGVDDSITLPTGQRYAFENASADFKLLEVTLPDAVALTATVD
ncbi:cupin [Rhodoferax koreense]|uniref:Cupin n=2 Tax=Rhodoferax koreensis TaxID=1842727 RepID=A0A1P8K4P1_9BURK|nr:cupin [Rhodoferax koreense]